MILDVKSSRHNNITPPPPQTSDQRLEQSFRFVSHPLWFSNMATTLGCFLNLSVILKAGSSISSASVRSSWLKDMFISFTMFEKQILNVLVTSRFSDKILSSFK